VPRIVVIPSPMFDLYDHVVEVGRAVEAHLDVIVAVDDEWKDLIPAYDDADLTLKLKMNILDAMSGCKTGVGNVCPAVILHRSDIELLWLVDDGTTKFLSMKEMLRRKELLYATSVEPPEEIKLFRLQTFRPLEPSHSRFFNGQFENLELELYESLYGSRDVERWRRLARVATLPAITMTVAEAARRYVMELCVFGDYNVCPGILLIDRGNQVDVKILKISAKAENYLSRIDLAGLLASSTAR
jgi:hypothetical protein